MLKKNCEVKKGALLFYTYVKKVANTVETKVELNRAPQSTFKNLLESN
jgi:hypothetical protein